MLFFNSLFFVSFLVNLCRYDNQTNRINQSIITRNCEKKCDCNFRNGTAILICKPLCEIGKDPQCDQHSETTEEYQAPVNGSNCTCIKKKCVPGKLLEYSLHFQRIWH